MVTFSRPEAVKLIYYSKKCPENQCMSALSFRT